MSCTPPPKIRKPRYLIPAILKIPRVEDPVQHVMQTKTILRELLQHCNPDYETLCTFRLVNKLWKSAIDLQWKGYRTPYAIDGSFIPREREYIRGRMLITDILMEKPRVDAQRNFVLKGWSICEYSLSRSYGFYLGMGIKSHFWSVYSRQIAVLTLVECEVGLEEGRLQGEIEQELPNLERLTLKKCTLLAGGRGLLAAYHNVTPYSEESQRSALTKLKVVHFEDVIFKAHPTCAPGEVQGKITLKYPNLEEVTMGFTPENFSITFKAVGASSSAQESKMWAFNTIERLGSEADRVHREFKCREYKISRLSINSVFPGYQELLQNEANHLEELCFDSLASDEPTSFPCNVPLEHLTKLCLVGNASDNFNFLGLLPNLNELKWYNRKNYDDSKGSEVVRNTTGLATDFRLDSVETLELEWKPYGLECWVKLGGWMPCVKSLKCRVVGDTHLELICKQWQRLQHLELAEKSNVSMNQVKLSLIHKPSLESLIWKPSERNNQSTVKNKKLGKTVETLAVMCLKSLSKKNIILPC